MLSLSAIKNHNRKFQIQNEAERWGYTQRDTSKAPRYSQFTRNMKKVDANTVIESNRENLDAVVNESIRKVTRSHNPFVDYTTPSKVSGSHMDPSKVNIDEIVSNKITLHDTARPKRKTTSVTLFKNKSSESSGMNTNVGEFSLSGKVGSRVNHSSDVFANRSNQVRMQQIPTASIKRHIQKLVNKPKELVHTGKTNVVHKRLNIDPKRMQELIKNIKKKEQIMTQKRFAAKSALLSAKLDGTTKKTVKKSVMKLNPNLVTSVPDGEGDMSRYAKDAKTDTDVSRIKLQDVGYTKQLAAKDQEFDKLNKNAIKRTTTATSYQTHKISHAKKVKIQMLAQKIREKGYAVSDVSAGEKQNARRIDLADKINLRDPRVRVNDVTSGLKESTRPVDVSREVRFKGAPKINLSDVSSGMKENAKRIDLADKVNLRDPRVRAKADTVKTYMPKKVNLNMEEIGKQMTKSSQLSVSADAKVKTFTKEVQFNKVTNTSDRVLKRENVQASVTRMPANKNTSFDATSRTVTPLKKVEYRGTEARIPSSNINRAPRVNQTKKTSHASLAPVQYGITTEDTMYSLRDRAVAR